MAEQNRHPGDKAPEGEPQPVPKKRYLPPTFLRLPLLSTRSGQFTGIVESEEPTYAPS
jgi:hypothetical protein